MCTTEELSGHPLGDHVEVEQRREDSFQVAKHGREPQAEEHDEEEHRPHLRARHLDHSLSEHYEGQTCS